MIRYLSSISMPHSSQIPPFFASPGPFPGPSPGPFPGGAAGPGPFPGPFPGPSPGGFNSSSVGFFGSSMGFAASETPTVALASLAFAASIAACYYTR